MIDQIDVPALARDAAALVRVPSVTGDERAVMAAFAAMAEAAGLEARLIEHDLAAVRALPGYPGQVNARSELIGVEVVVRGRSEGAPRFLLNGHLDVVEPGALPWSRDPWSGEIADGRLHGRGSLDMKGAVVACLHALIALRRTGGASGDVVLHVVASEEDGGQGAFAALARDDRFAGCLIPEATGFDVVAAHGGSLQLEGVVRGRATHAAHRLAGVSAIDRYLPLHTALQTFEDDLNRDVTDPLMAALPLPYPIVVGELHAGRWVSQVPDELRFRVRVGVPVGRTVADVWAELGERLAAAADDRGPAPELTLLGAFQSAATPVDHPLVAIAAAAVESELGRPPAVIGVPWGADMQHVVARGIPCVMVGTTGASGAHGVDEWVEIDELALLARVILRVVGASGEAPWD